MYSVFVYNYIVPNNTKKGMFCLKKLIMSLCFLLVFSSISSTAFASGLEKVDGPDDSVRETKSVESFEYQEFADGKIIEGHQMYDLIGHKHVNLLRTTNYDPKTGIVKSTTHSLEDFYNLEGEYVSSEIIIKDYVNNFNTGKALGSNKTLEVNTPIAKFAPTSSTVSENLYSEMNEETKGELETYILSLTKNDSNFKVEIGDEIGLTFEDLNKIDEDMAKHRKKVMTQQIYKDKKYNTTIDGSDISPMNTIAVGAFDNYYSQNSSTGDFTIQVLTYSSPHRYWKRTGNTRGTANTNNANSSASFFQYINTYENAINLGMNYLDNAEVAAWQSYVASLALYVAAGAVSLSGGPIGWTAFAVVVGDSLLLLKTYTSAKYATAQRAANSIAAQKALQTAQGIMVYNRWDTTTYNTVKGF